MLLRTSSVLGDVNAMVLSLIVLLSCLLSKLNTLVYLIPPQQQAFHAHHQPLHLPEPSLQFLRFYFEVG